MDVEDEIEGIKDDIKTFKDEVEEDYYKSEYIDDHFSTVEEVGAVYRDSMARNLSPFYSHDFTDVYDAENPEGYWTQIYANATQLDDGWAHFVMDNSSGTGQLNAQSFVRASGLPIVAGTLLVELRNVTASGALTIGRANTAAGLTFENIGYDGKDAYLIPCTVADPTNAVAIRQRFVVPAGQTAEFDARLSYYQGEYDGKYKQFNADTANLTRDYATKTWTKQTAEDYSIGAAQKYTATIANPNLTPFYAHDLADVWNASTNPNGYWVEMPLRATQLEDGWAHITLNNASGTSTMYSRTYVRPMASVPDKATLMIEIRNLDTNVTSQTTAPRLWFNASASNSQMYRNVVYFVEGGTYRLALVKTDNVDPAYFSRWWWGIEAGGTAEFDARISIYENATDSKGGTIPYAGNFKPYVTGQDALSKEYSTKSELKVGLDNITSTVDEKLAQTTRNLLMGCVGKEFSTVTWMSDNDVSDGLWRPYHSETTLTATTDGIRADHAGTANGGIAIPLVADGCISAGETLTLSFEYRTNRAPFGAMYVLNAATPNVSQGAPADLVADGEWHAFEHTWTAKGNAQVPRALLISYYKQAGAWIEIKDGSCLLTRGESFTKSSTFKQTVDGMDGRITATEDGLAVQETLIRQYAGGVLVCKVGEAVGALVNASGSFDVVSVTWSGNTPTVGDTLATFSGTAAQIGASSSDHATIDQDGLSVYDANGDVAASFSDTGVTMLGQALMLGTTMEQAYTFWAGGEAIGLIGGVRTQSGQAYSGVIVNPKDGSTNKTGVSLIGKTLDIVHYLGLVDGTPSWDSKSFGMGNVMDALSLGGRVFQGTKILNPNNSQVLTLFTATECQSMFGRALSQTKDVIIVQNGDTGAYGGQITGGTNASGALTATINPTKSGPIRYQYIVILGA